MTHIGITVYYIGQQCEWNTLINGKITRLKGKITDMVGSMFRVEGDGWSDIINASQLIFTKSTKK